MLAAPAASNSVQTSAAGIPNREARRLHYHHHQHTPDINMNGRVCMCSEDNDAAIHIAAADPVRHMNIIIVGCVLFADTSSSDVNPHQQRRRRRVCTHDVHAAYLRKVWFARYLHVCILMQLKFAPAPARWLTRWLRLLLLFYYCIVSCLLIIVGRQHTQSNNAGALYISRYDLLGRAVWPTADGGTRSALMLLCLSPTTAGADFDCSVLIQRDAFWLYAVFSIELPSSRGVYWICTIRAFLARGSELGIIQQQTASCQHSRSRIVHGLLLWESGRDWAGMQPASPMWIRVA